MAARIRHIALCVKDIKATADFYEKAFGLKRTEIKEGKTAWNCYMSDGEVNLALLQYKGEEGSGVPKGWTGIHHFGFQCDDLPAQQKQVEKAGGKFFYDLGDPHDEGFERKFKDPNGIVFDINWKGWQLTKSKVKNAKGGLRPEMSAPKAKSGANPLTRRAAAARKKVSKKTARPGKIAGKKK
jgi:predicted enzyme related to lactoylglutathione lyase